MIPLAAPRVAQVALQALQHVDSHSPQVVSHALASLQAVSNVPAPVSHLQVVPWVAPSLASHLQIVVSPPPPWCAIIN